MAHKEVFMNKYQKLAIAGLSSAIITSTLTGCNNHKVWEFEYTFNKAIIFNNNVATIVTVKNWTDYDGEQIQLELEDGTVLVTSSFDTKLVYEDGNITAEDIARAIGGKDVEITYLEEAKSLQYTK